MPLQPYVCTTLHSTVRERRSRQDPVCSVAVACELILEDLRENEHPKAHACRHLLSFPHPANVKRASEAGSSHTKRQFLEIGPGIACAQRACGNQGWR